MNEYQYATQEPVESPGFSYAGNVGGEFHIDGTPMRLATFIVVAIVVTVILQRSGFRFHVVG